MQLKLSPEERQELRSFSSYDLCLIKISCCLKQFKYFNLISQQIPQHILQIFKYCFQYCVFNFVNVQNKTNYQTFKTSTYLLLTTYLN